MSLISLLPLLLAGSGTATSLDMNSWQRCRREVAPLVRLACYDSLGDAKGATSEQVAVAVASSAWQAIWAQEQVRTSDSPPFLLQQDAERGRAILTRPALRGATLAIGCVDSITHIRLRLDVPWRGELFKLGWMVNQTTIDLKAGLSGIRVCCSSMGEACQRSKSLSAGSVIENCRFILSMMCRYGSILVA